VPLVPLSPRQLLLAAAVFVLLCMGLPWLWSAHPANGAPPANGAAMPADPALAPPPLPGTRVGRGRLSLQTDGPQVDVYLNDERLGRTPLIDVEVPAGRLKLRLVNPSAGILRTFEIDVPEGSSAQALISAR
jgi:serine/threonine-protein kinase